MWFTIKIEPTYYRVEAMLPGSNDSPQEYGAGDGIRTRVTPRVTGLAGLSPCVKVCSIPLGDPGFYLRTLKS